MKKFFSKLASNEAVAGYAFILPNFLGLLVFTSLPVLASLLLSFFDWDIVTWPPKFVGIDNFVQLLGFHREYGHVTANNPNFWLFVYNTVYLMLGIPISMIGSLALALVMNQKLKGITIYRTIFFLPSVCAGVAVCMLWMWLLNPDVGLINAGLQSLFDLLHIPLDTPKWLTNKHWAKPALMFMGFWGGIGGMQMILYLAALQGVPRDLYEAADLDGANGWKKFLAVTLPFLSPTTFFMIITGVIAGFQSGFQSAYIMTKGGPYNSTTTIEYYIYKVAYEDQHMGYASAIAWFLFVVILIITLFNWRFGGKLVHY